MMLRRRMALSGLTVVFLAAAAAPVLADTGFYVGATAGQSLFHQNRSDADATIMAAFNAAGVTVVNGSSSLDKADFAFGGLVGYRFTPNVETTLSVPSANATTSGRDSVSANSVDPLVGVGVGWHVAKHVTLRAEYTRFANVGDKNKTGETNIDLFDLGVTYSFP